MTLENAGKSPTLKLKTPQQLAKNTNRKGEQREFGNGPGDGETGDGTVAVISFPLPCTVR